MDKQLRELERQAAVGDPGAAEKLKAARLRAFGPPKPDYIIHYRHYGRLPSSGTLHFDGSYIVPYRAWITQICAQLERPSDNDHEVNIAIDDQNMVSAYILRGTLGHAFSPGMPISVKAGSTISAIVKRTSGDAPDAWDTSICVNLLLEAL